MLKRIFTAALAITMILSISGCGIQSLEANPEVRPTPTWDPPVDGRWPHTAHGKLLGLGDEFIVKSVYGPMYSGALVGPPQFTDFDGGKVTMSQEMMLTRMEAASGQPPATVGVYLKYGIDELSEVGVTQLEGTVQCGEGTTVVGDVIACTISARTSTRDIVNSYWVVSAYGSSNLAAWPGQEARP